MSRTTLLQERRMQAFQDVLGHWQAQRLSALEAAELLGMSERSFRRAQRRKCGPGGALSLPRRPRLRRHGPGAGRHAQRHRDLRARPGHGDHRAHARPRGSASTRRRPTATPRCARPKRSGANGRDGACSTSTPTRNPTPSSSPPPSIRTASSRLRSTWCGKPASSSGCTAGSSPRSSRTAARPA